MLHIVNVSVRFCRLVSKLLASQPEREWRMKKRTVTRFISMTNGDEELSPNLGCKCLCLGIPFHLLGICLPIATIPQLSFT